MLLRLMELPVIGTVLSTVALWMLSLLILVLLNKSKISKWRTIPFSALTWISSTGIWLGLQVILWSGTKTLATFLLLTKP